MLVSLLYIVSGIIAIPVAVLLVQVLSSLKKGQATNAQSTVTDFSITILVPAHNEEEVIEKTLLSIKKKISGNDKIIVIADNCTDNTEKIVWNLGIETLTRTNTAELGKGFALGAGIDHISKLELKPDVLMILDADCVVSRGEVKKLAAKSIELNRPVQALYLMRSNEHAGIGQKVAEFAWLVKNWVRPLGFRSLNLPCQLTGSGMAFPMGIVDAGKFKTANIVEDLELGMEYAMAGHPPFFYPDVTVTSCFPMDAEGEESQRKRWEHGHLTTIVKLTPRLIKNGITRRDINCAALAVDLLVPPLALLSISLILLNAVCLGYMVMTAVTSPFMVSSGLLVIFCSEILVAWYCFGQSILRTKHLLYIPIYIMKKVPLYLMFLIKRQAKWVKTSRKNEGSSSDE